MNNRMMAFGAVMYDAWWIFVLTLALSGGIGWALQSVWWAWLAWLLVSAGLGWFGVQVMLWWHERCEARRWQRYEAITQHLGNEIWVAHQEGWLDMEQIEELHQIWRERNGGDDGEQ